MEGVERHQVRLMKHSSAWEAEFEQVRALLLTIWSGSLRAVQHVYRQVFFRDDLNAHPDAAAEYAGIKETLAAKFAGDRASNP